MSAENLLAGVIFSAIGLGAFIYGKKQGLWPATILGCLLMVYPYFTTETWQTVLIGGALTLGLFVLRG
jgi:predicted phage tail protein